MYLSYGYQEDERIAFVEAEEKCFGVFFLLADTIRESNMAG